VAKEQSARGSNSSEVGGFNGRLLVPAEVKKGGGVLVTVLVRLLNLHPGRTGRSWSFQRSLTACQYPVQRNATRKPRALRFLLAANLRPAGESGYR